MAYTRDDAYETHKDYKENVNLWEYFIRYLQELLIKICLIPFESLSLELTAFILSRTAGCLCFTLTVNPPFCKIDKSVLPPAEVFLCLDAGSGEINIGIFGP